MSIRIALADDHNLFRSGLRTMLEQQADLEIVAEVSDGWEAVHSATELRPDVLVMDVTMPGMNGIQATRRIRHDVPEVKVLCLSMHRDRQIVLAALEAGASGYLLKESALEELHTAIHDVFRGRTYLSPSIAGTVVEAYRSGQLTGPSTAFEVLTDREREVLQLIAEGYSTKEISERLEVSVKTISTHRENIQGKLKVQSIAQLTKYAIREGLTSVDQ